MLINLFNTHIGKIENKLNLVVLRFDFDINYNRIHKTCLLNKKHLHIYTIIFVLISIKNFAHFY